MMWDLEQSMGKKLGKVRTAGLGRGDPGLELGLRALRLHSDSALSPGAIHRGNDEDDLRAVEEPLGEGNQRRTGALLPVPREDRDASGNPYPTVHVGRRSGHHEDSEVEERRRIYLGKRLDEE